MLKLPAKFQIAEHIKTTIQRPVDFTISNTLFVELRNTIGVVGTLRANFHSLAQNHQIQHELIFYETNAISGS